MQYLNDGCREDIQLSISVPLIEWIVLGNEDQNKPLLNNIQICKVLINVWNKFQSFLAPHQFPYCHFFISQDLKGCVRWGISQFGQKKSWRAFMIWGIQTMYTEAEIMASGAHHE